MTEEALIRVRELKKLFPVRRGFLSSIFSRESWFIHAVDGVSFDIRQDEVLGLVGESGGVLQGRQHN
jgi:ABC-type oligopeptide transport system ATPase subunit